MSKSRNKNAVVVIDSNNLPAVPSQLEILKNELSQLKAITETQYKTTGNLDSIDIKTETKVENLVKAYSSIIAKEQAYHSAAKELKLTTYPAFSVSGGNKEQWKHDIQLRIAVINHSERKAELEALVKEGEQFLTKEDQYQMYLQKVAATVNK